LEPQLKPVAFPPGLMHRLLNVKGSRQRKWRENIDPNSDRETYSRRDVFAHFVVRYFEITKDVKSSNLIVCDWSEVFAQCNHQPFSVLRKCRVIVNSKAMTAEVKLKTVQFDIDNPSLKWACMDRVYKEYIEMITNDFSSSSDSTVMNSIPQYSSVK
jgi:ribosome-associated toxin RatA of RatAB toxin-antitoxin module